MIQKKIHKSHRMDYKIGSGFRYIPMCKVHNKTYAYFQTDRWKDVTCKKCLEYK